MQGAPVSWESALLHLGYPTTKQGIFAFQQDFNVAREGQGVQLPETGVATQETRYHVQQLASLELRDWEFLVGRKWRAKCIRLTVPGAPARQPLGARRRRRG